MPIKLFDIALVMHGLVHLLYVGHSLRKFELSAGLSWPDHSWLLGKFLGVDVSRKLIAASLSVAAIGFAAAGLGSLLNQGWWQTAAVASAAFSTLIFLTAWDGGFKRLSDQGGFGVLINLAVILLLRVLNWTA